jgi:serine/threonine protein phosphatase PrpC
MPEASLAGGGGGAQRSPERLLCDTARLDTSRLSSGNAVGVDTITSTGKGTSANQDSSLVSRFANGGLGGGYSGPGVNKSEACDSPIAARGGAAAPSTGSPVGRGTMLVGVFDGHGDAGHRVSRAAAAALQKRVEQRLKEEIRKAEKKQPPRGGGGDKENSDKHRDGGRGGRDGGRDGGRVRKDDGRGQTGSGSGDIAARVMYQSLRDVRTEIEKTNIDTTFSGTTAVAALRHGEHLIVGNIGDSRAVLGRRTQASGGKPAGIKAVELSCDHTPEYDAERLKKLNSRVHPSMVPAGPGGQYRFMGPQRVWDKTGVHGLAMARSLGDTHLAPFVTPEPEVTCKRLDRDDKFLIIGSDGIWDCINSQEAVTIAARFSKPKDAAAALCKIARERWKAGTGGQMSDDITAVVTRL